MAVPIVVLSHLRWDFVYQRPQQVLSRLAADRPVIFIEEPRRDGADRPHWVRRNPEPGVFVYQPHTAIEEPEHFTDRQLEVIREMLPAMLSRERLSDYVAWFYTPMALPLLDALNPQAVVYDCMDELSAFLGAPPEMIERERDLLSRADIVFTGGPSLYESKRNRHSNVHCFPSSVDAAHFAKAQDASIEPKDQARLPHPKLGFFGVIDERMDLGILDTMSRARSDWQIVMVGPVVKINPGTLPRRDNIHYLGQRSYEQLPGYLAGWDVCMMPFARNESTKFISPTKTLEYMAAEKMIVSTSITDVARPYGEIVYLGDKPSHFIQACDAALNASDDEKQQRIAAMRRVLGRTSWNNTARNMAEQIDKVLSNRRGKTVPTRSTASPTGVSPSDQGQAQTPVLIIGAGPTGLSAAYHLGKEATLLERNTTVGGLCRSFHKRGFTFDMAGHIMFSKDPYVHEMYETLLGDNVHWQDREAWVYSKNVYTRYPFQGCLYGLPAHVITECIIGAIEARFGPLSRKDELVDAVSQAAANNHRTGNGEAKAGNGRAVSSSSSDPQPTPSRGFRNNPAALKATQDARRKDSQDDDGRPARAVHRDETSDRVTCDSENAIDDCCADGILESEVALSEGSTADADASSHASESADNFEQFIYRTWGKGIAKHFAIPYNRKLWAVPLTEMETSWLGGRVPMPDLEEMVRNALSPAAKPMGPNARFGYPLRGGFQALMEGFLPHVQDRLHLNTTVTRICPSSHKATTLDGRTFDYDVLISTMPLPLLVRAIGDAVPDEVREAVSRLRYVSVRCINIGIGRENLTDKHWIYYPEDTVFHRIFVQGNASPHCNPEGGFGLTCEITYSPTKPLPCEGDALIDRCIDDCRKVGIFNSDDPVWLAFQVDLPYAYVVYDHDRAENVRIIRDWLAQQDILLAGRYSEWEYYNSDHAFVAGRNVAAQARAIVQESART